MSRLVVIVRGCSGSGKSTWLKREYPSAEIFSADRFFEEIGRFDPNLLTEAHNECLRGFTVAVLAGRPLVGVDNTNCTLHEASPYIRLAEALDYRVQVVRVVPPDAGTAHKRGKHGAPLSVICCQLQELEESLPDWPTFWPREEVIRT